MPKAKSKAQARFFRGVAGGTIDAPGLTKKEAKSRVEHVPTKNLPAKVKKQK